MQDLLSHYPVYFPKRNDELYTLKEFLDRNTDDKYQLPIIVNVTSSNNYGRSFKNILTKNTTLLLVDVFQIDSILAEYHRSDGRHHLHRHRLMIGQGKRAKASTKFRTMKKLSKSLASLTTVNQINNSNNDDDEDNEFDGDDNTYNQRNLVKILKEERSSSTPICRIPVDYQRYFELLNENDQSIEPYHKLTDLIINEFDDNDPEKHIEKWPHAFFLRSSCTAYLNKYTPEFFYSTTNDQKSNSTASSDSCYGPSSDLDSQKNPIILDDDTHILQAGQVLTILGDCFGLHIRTSDKESKEQQRPLTPSPSYFSTSWIRDKSRMIFSKKHRQSPTPDPISNEINTNKFFPKKSERYLKCQTQGGDIVYISLQESGLFSPLNIRTYRSKPNTELTRMDMSGVFQLKDLLSNIRFPVSVRHLDGSISFDNIFSVASINRHETPTKLRLLAPYNEHVIYACPINLSPTKPSKTSSPLIIIPLSVHADIEIQPCINMYDISETEDFRRLIEICYQLIEQYQTGISLIHFPRQIINDINQQKRPLNKKRSQSESFVEYIDEDLKSKFRHSDDQLNYNTYSTDNSLSPVPSPLRYRDSIETVKTETEQPTIRHLKNDQQKRSSRDDHTFEDQIYEDVDKIYDYIRSGNVTDDVQKIQAKERVYNRTNTMDASDSSPNRSEQQTTTISHSPGKMMTHRFVPKILENDLEFHPSKHDGNVDDDEAHALYLASKQREKSGSQDLSNSRPTTKMKRINK